MACCLFCFSDEPVENDPRLINQSAFDITMAEAIYKGQPNCCLSYCFPCCFNYYTRYEVLDKDLSNYSCCQGYLNGLCGFHAGQCNESQCPECMLCLESFCCLGPSMSSSRLFVMDRYGLKSDPMDNRLVRFSNCIVMLSCVCDCLSTFIRELRDCADCMRNVAKCVFYCTFGCMAAQVLNEVKLRRQLIEEATSRNSSIVAPDSQEVLCIKAIQREPIDYTALASAPEIKGKVN